MDCPLDLIRHLRTVCKCALCRLQGDQRTHSHVVALRAVTSSDGMTADWCAAYP